MKTEKIEYNDNGVTLEGYMAYDDQVSGARPAVLVSHAWAGRSEFECQRAETLAKLGYVGFALDMYGKGVSGTSNDENMTLMAPFMGNRASLRQRITAALTTVKGFDVVDSGKIGAIGFCFGGLCVLDLARSGADVKGVVSFHGLLNAPENLANEPIISKMLALHGQDDPMAPPEQVASFQKEMSDAGADWQLHAYGNTLHAFTAPEANDPGFGTVYNADADRRSLLAMKNFLEEVFLG